MVFTWLIIIELGVDFGVGGLECCFEFCGFLVVVFGMLAIMFS